MDRQISINTSKGDDAYFSFLETLSSEFPTAPAHISHGKPGTLPSPSTSIPTKGLAPIRIATPEQRFPKRRNSASITAKTKPLPRMAITETHRQCLELCQKTNTQIDRISLHILECLTSAKQPPDGFDVLAHTFLDTCQSLLYFEGGLREYHHTERKYSTEMIMALNYKFRVLHVDFHDLDKLLGKLLGSSNPVKQWLEKSVRDKDIRKMETVLAKSRDGLRMSSLVFQWELDSENAEREMGIGYTALAAALNRRDQIYGHGSDTKDIEINYQPALSPVTIHQSPIEFHKQQLPLLPRSVSDTSSSIRQAESPVLGRAPEGIYGSQNRASMNSSSVTAYTESDLDNFLGDLKVIRFAADPTLMPRRHVRHTIESDSPKMKASLLAAIRSKNQRIVEQLLKQGVPPNPGSDLIEAILAHDEQCVRLLLLYGADPNYPDRDGITPLSASVEKSFLAGAKVLLQYCADPNLVAGQDQESPLAAAVIANMVGFSNLLLAYNGDANHITADGSTLLISAIKKNTPRKFVDLLLDYGSDPNSKSSHGKTALFEAITVSRPDIVTSLLEHGADPNLPGPKHMLWPSTYNPACLQLLLDHGAHHKKCPGIMELAVSLNEIESVRILLDAGVNPDIKKDGTYTPLCTAIRDDRQDIMLLLLTNGANPNVMASEYPAFKCITHNRLHFLPILVAAGANLREPKGIIETAVSCKNMEALRWLLDEGVNPNDKNSEGKSPLTTAIRDDRIEIVDLLLQRGANPNMRGEDWPACMAVRNPPILKRILSVLSQPQAFKGILEMAVSANQLESVKLLLAAGVSVEDKNGGVFSPLTTAIREYRKEIVAYLLKDAGADVNAPGEHLPIVKALRRYHVGDTEIMEMLLEHGADPNRMYRGWNGFMQAVENGDLDVLKLLSRKVGVDLEVKDELGRNVVEIAEFRGWTEGVQVLEENDVGM
ncbi:Ankyrin repeat and KH domain-containing protein [Lachnellula suecica]|uniref:Ankyrin repeat and KH domain-containing protein n=1 Tax=Lachnellula suecica TaxID=602035 RepID=A0A8T9BYI4_9HELO|nr:Ankyrin repeat and KH domain-containing protein [Lachnellula suecica]